MTVPTCRSHDTGHPVPDFTQRDGGYIFLYILIQHMLADFTSYNYKFICIPDQYEQHVLVVGSGARRNVSTLTCTATGKAVHSNGRRNLGICSSSLPAKLCPV